MLKGETIRIRAMRTYNVFLEDGAKYGIGPVPVKHRGHELLRPGMALVVAENSARNGDTRVTLPCRCEPLLLRD